MKLTRRELVVAAGSVAAAAAFAQTPPSQPQGARDFAKEARDNVQHNGETLAKFGIPMATEPAFQFKA
ncbi:MAG TPA: hypothetical protein VGM43_15685 [Bryobacteraceae bacterium]